MLNIILHLQIYICNNFQESQLQKLSEMIEDQKKTFVFESQYMTLRKFAKLLSILRNQKVFQIKACISSPDIKLIKNLKNDLAKKKNYHFHPKPSPLLGKEQIDIQSARKGKYRRVIDFGGKLPAIMFVNQYRDKLRSLGQEFHVSMIWQGGLIKVYSQSPISPIFESQILNMKQKVKYVTDQNIALYLKLKMSKTIIDYLRQLDIKFLFLSRLKRVLFHSSKIQIEKIKQSIKKISYDAVILNFDIEIYSALVNRIYFRMLVYHCEPKLRQISQNYEVKHQINMRKLGIILHTQDPIFSEEPKQQLTEFLSKIIFITYYSKDPTNHILYIRNNKPNSNALQVMMSDIFVYTCWNTNKQISPSQVQKVFEMFFQQLGSKMILRIGIKTGNLNPHAIQKVYSLADKYKFVCQPPQFTDISHEILHIKFKSFNNRQRQNKVSQVFNFLSQLITGKCSQKSFVLPSNLLSEQLQQENVQDVAGQIQISNSNQKINQTKQIKEIIIEHNQEKGIQFDYKKTQIVMSQSFNLKNGKRNKKLQNVLLEQRQLQSRIWEIVIETNAYKPSRESNYIKCRLFPIQTFEFQSDLKIKKPVTLSFQHLLADRQYFLATKVEGTQDWELSYRMVVYNS